MADLKSAARTPLEKGRVHQAHRRCREHYRQAHHARRTETDDLSSAFLTAVGYVIDLAARNKDADFHECFASGALRRMGLKARLGFL
jgi:hypothetical protein